MPKGSGKTTQKRQTVVVDEALVGENAHAKATSSGRPLAGPDVEETVTVGDVTLDPTPMRLMMLLREVGTIKEVREVLRPLGYTPAEHARGWTLLHRCSGFSSVESGDEASVGSAIAALDAWDEPTFAIAEAALRHRHQAQCAFVFRDLKASRGVAAVVGLHTFLTRLDALESSPERAAMREADHAALATLAARGVTPAERKRMAAMVREAEVLHDDGAPEADDRSAAEQQASLREAHILRGVVDHRPHGGAAARPAHSAGARPAQGPRPRREGRRREGRRGEARVTGRGRLSGSGTRR
jgi:hypothetical protein